MCSIAEEVWPCLLSHPSGEGILYHLRRLVPVPFLLSTTHVPRSLKKNYGRNPRTRTTLVLSPPVLKRRRLSTCRRHLRSSLPPSRAVECPPDPSLAVHLSMLSAVRIYRIRMQALPLPLRGNGVSARSHLLPQRNDPHHPKRTHNEIMAGSLVHTIIDFAHSGVSGVCSRVVH